MDTAVSRGFPVTVVPNLDDEESYVIWAQDSDYQPGARLDAFHVFIYAPFEERVRRLRSTGKTEKESIELAETVDRERADFVKQYFDIEWPDRHRFHLMVNSGIGEEAAVETILDSLALYTKQRS